MSLEHATPYIGHKVVAIVFAMIPLAVRIHAGDLEDRLILAVCGMLGSGIALLTDWPLSKKEGAARIAIGFALCAIFAPYIAVRFGYQDESEAVVAAAGLIGVTSWYLMGSVSRFLHSLGKSDVIGSIIRAKVGLPPMPPEEPKK